MVQRSFLRCKQIWRSIARPSVRVAHIRYPCPSVHIRRTFNNTAHIVDQTPVPEPFVDSSPPTNTEGLIIATNSSRIGKELPRLKTIHSPQYDIQRAPAAPKSPHSRSPVTLSPSVRSYLPHLANQPPFYATIHVYGKPYLVTQGDSVRLPFLMHGVLPGDIIRLDRLTTLGSRDWTMRAGSDDPHSIPETATKPTELITGKTEGLPHLPDPTHSANIIGKTARITKMGPKAYLDERLFTCRAVVTGVDSEPMRFKEKTKQRQRHVKTVKSKHRHTIIKIRELTIRSLEEIESESQSGPSGKGLAGLTEPVTIISENPKSV